MGDERVISMSYNVVWSEISDMVEKKKFEYIPAIAYLVQYEGPEKLEKPTLLNFPRPFSLYEFGLPIEVLCRYIGEEIKRKEDLKVARMAYLKLKNFASRCADRVMADLICSVLLKTWERETDEFIYFIEGPPSNKILARLSYLFPTLENLTICFVTWRREDLITSVMSFQAGKLEFDIHRLLSTEIMGFQGPYPGTSEESLVQTYFYKHPELKPGAKVSPIRLDIFSQGLLESDFEDKKEIIKEKFEDNAWTMPFPIEDTIETILPKGLRIVIESWKQEYNQELERIIKQRI